MKPTIVIGLGNTLLSDEGVGVALLRELSGRAEEFPRADFVELGTGGMSVLHAMAGRRKAVILDCARMCEMPGALRRFTPDDVRSPRAMEPLSMHHGSVLDFIAISRALADAPEEIVIFGIEPETLAPGADLGLKLKARMAEYLAAVSGELS